MGQTKRFLEKMYNENDALNEAHALLRQKCEELYGGAMVARCCSALSGESGIEEFCKI